jgi:hypothetical protein
VVDIPLHPRSRVDILIIAKGCALEIPRRGRRGIATPLCDLATLEHQDKPG